VAPLLQFPPVIALVFALAAGQEFGVEWLDRVTHEREPARGPMRMRPVETVLQAGALYAYDTNLFLEPDHEDGSNVVIPFVRGRLDYAAPRWDAAADVLLNYKRYLQEPDESSFEQRAYGRLRYLGPRVTLEAAEIFRHESDPIDAVFAERAERYVSSTFGHGAVQITPELALEADVLFGLIFFNDPVFDDSDNWNVRADVTGAWRVAQTLEFLVQAGALAIDYQNRGAADADGYALRAGFRGDPIETLSVAALIGVVDVRSDPLAVTGVRQEARTGDVSVHIRYEAIQNFVVWTDYTRQIGFAGPGDPFQVVDRATAIAEWEVAPEFRLRGRIQYDRVHSALGLRRTFWSAGPGATYAFTPYFRVDAGVTLRVGNLDLPGDSAFSDVIAQVGFVFTR
jgi:hypothetical protein